MKRLIALTLCLVMLAGLCACGAKNKNATATDATATDAAKNGGVDAVDSLTYSVEQAENAVVVYFSHNDVIREAAEFAAEARDLDLIEIVPKKDYPDDPAELAETIREEREKNVRPALKDQPENLDGYDIIFLGFPVWDGSIPMAVATFLEDYDMMNKAIVPFCYAEDGSVGESLEAIAGYCRYSAIVSAYMIPSGDFKDNEPVFEGWMTQVLFG